MDKQYCVVSHTHWDREWYQSFDLFRMRLVDLIDNLLKIFAKDENYVFHLDAQTVVLEDYLEIRPHKKGELKKYIENGQLVVGPWYVQNDFYLSSGESTIRNLLIGTKIAKSFGGGNDVGYCPDQFGIIGQLPQLLSQFGLKSFVFGRGNKSIETVDGQPVIKNSPSEFLWKGIDGTVLPAVCMIRWYNNAQRFSKDINKALRLVEMNEAEFSTSSATPYRLLMNGVDHLEAQEDLLPILKELETKLEKSHIYQGRLSEFVKELFTYIEENNCDIATISGELRNGTDNDVLQGTLSSRVYLKQNNDLCENMLIYRIEPLYRMLAHFGFEDLYPSDYLNYLWKELVKNHAHDSICGCSNDAIHRQMEERFFRIQQTAGQLIKKGMNLAAHHSGIDWLESDDYIIALANTTQCVKKGMVTIEAYIPVAENIDSFEILDADGNKVEFIAEDLGEKKKNVYSPINLPTAINVKCYRLYLKVDGVLPYSFKYFVLRKSDTSNSSNVYVAESNSISNEFYNITVDDRGAISLKSQKLNEEIKDFIHLEDTADAGHSYLFKAQDNDKPISNVGKLVSYNAKKSSLYESLELCYDVDLPKEMEGDGRSEELLTHRIELTLTLVKSENKVRIGYKFTNRSCDHRMRLIFKTGINTNKSFALSAFEMRENELGAVSVKGVRGSDMPNAGLVMLENTDLSAAVYNKGLHEYEHLTSNGDIALTVLRSTGTISGTDGGMCGEDWITPDCQSLREICGEVAFAYVENRSEAIEEVSSYQTDVLTCFDSVDIRKFSGGRPALQDSEVNEIFFREDKYDGLYITPEKSVLSVNNSNIIITAFKRAQNGTGSVIRFYNSSYECQKAKISLPEGVTRAYKMNADETVVDCLNVTDGAVDILVAPAEIVTIKLS